MRSISPIHEPVQLTDVVCVGGGCKNYLQKKIKPTQNFSFSFSLSNTHFALCFFFFIPKLPFFTLFQLTNDDMRKLRERGKKKIQAIKKFSHLLCTLVSLKLNEFLIFKFFFFCSGTSWISFLVAALQVWHPKKLSKQDHHQLTSKFQQDTTSNFSLIKSLS